MSKIIKLQAARIQRRIEEYQADLAQQEMMDNARASLAEQQEENARRQAITRQRFLEQQS